MTTLSVILAFFGSHCETLCLNTQGDRMSVIATLFIVIASEAWQSEEKQNSKIKKQNDRAKMKKQLVISGQQSANY
jgi:hypothetical protein